MTQDNLQRKQQAEQVQRQKYPFLETLLNATSAKVLCQLLDDKHNLYLEPSPEICELNDIYHDPTAAQQFLCRCIIYAFTIKENTSPIENAKNLFASNLLITVRHNTVNQLLCFIGEYPSMKQYSRGFDYTHFSSMLKAYCSAWADEQNKLIEKRIKEEERLAGISDADCGVGALEGYLRDACMAGVDIRKSPLYRMRPEYRSLIDRIAGSEDMSDEEATETHYGIARSEARVRANRKKLPSWLLSAEEIMEFAKEANSSF